MNEEKLSDIYQLLRKKSFYLMKKKNMDLVYKKCGGN